MSWIMIFGIACVTYTLAELLRAGVAGSAPATSPTGEMPSPETPSRKVAWGVVDPETGQDVEIQVDRRVRHDPEKAKLGRRATDRVPTGEAREPTERSTVG